MKKLIKYFVSVVLLLSIGLNFYFFYENGKGNNIKLEINNIESSTIANTSTYTINVTNSPYNSIHDDAESIQLAIDKVSSQGGGTVFLPTGRYKLMKTIYLPDNTSIIGSGQGENSTVLNYFGEGYAIKSTGKHRRVNIENLRINLNGKNSGIHLGEIGKKLSDDTFPAHLGIRHVTVGGIGINQIGIRFSNASHINLLDVSSGYGQTTGGHGLFIFADKLNSGVFLAQDSTFGRVDASTVRIEIDGSVNLDTFAFNGCYFGGAKPIRIGKNAYVRNVNFQGIHIEGRSPDADSVNMVELYNVVAVNFIGTSLIGFNQEKSNGFVFKGNASKVNVLGVEANGVKKAIYKVDGGSVDSNSILQEASLTNGSTAKQFYGF